MLNASFAIISVDNMLDLYEKVVLGIDKGDLRVYITMDDKSENKISYRCSLIQSGGGT